MRPAKKKKSVFSKRLIALRESLGMNQQQLADSLGVPKNHINYLECRASNPRMTTVQRLAKFFDVSVAYFFGED